MSSVSCNEGYNKRHFKTEKMLNTWLDVLGWGAGPAERKLVDPPGKVLKERRIPWSRKLLALDP